MNKPIQQLQSDLTARFPERKDVIFGALAAVLAGEHVLLLGPPGTAKSALARALAQAFSGTQYYEWLLTKFTTPEELFGPLSLRGLEQDRFSRTISGKLPEAHFAFLDEIGRASSSILNVLLTIANERTFHNDGTVVNCPLISLFGASNSIPDSSEGLDALWDRFMLRYDLSFLMRPPSMRSMLLAPDPTVPTSMSITDLRRIQGDVARVAVTDDTVDALLAIRDALRAEGIIASDRRWKRALKVVKAAAWLEGDAATSPQDLALLCHVVWREPKEKAKVARIVGKLADPIGAQALEIVDAARETAAKVAGLQSGDRKVYIAQAAQALEQFQAQQKKLGQLAKGAGRRASTVIQDANDEIVALHTELARTVSAGLGLRSARS